MRRINDPRQAQLFDPFKPVFSETAWHAVEKGWYGVFRHVILESLKKPVEALAQGFCPDNGAPTKELYSMAGLLLIKDFMDWSGEMAAEMYMFHAGVHYALNLAPTMQSMSERTVQRYEKLFVEGETACLVMEQVTGRLVNELGLVVDRQRLDSTHVLSDMATFARARLMGVTIRRFLTQVKRHNDDLYKGLPSGLRARYEPAEGRMFAEVKTKEQRGRLRQEVAEEMLFLVDRFGGDESLSGWSSYKHLVRVLEEQCEVKSGKVEVEGVEKMERSVEVREQTGGQVMQNPSDPGATLDGHKGPGYKVQVSETCSPDNEVQLIVAAIPQTAVESDAHSLRGVLESLGGRGMRPKELLADGAYGSDENAQGCAAQGVELVSPASAGVLEGSDPKANRLGEFEVEEETGQVTRCPAGHAPLHSRYDGAREKTHLSMAEEACEGCDRLGSCPVQRRRKRYVGHFTRKRMRLARRRREEGGEGFRRRYRLRSGIESTHSGLKRRVGLGRLRVRGRGLHPGQQH